MSQNEFLSWVAGFFDGEGTIASHGTIKPRSIHVFITNTNRAALDEIKSLFGGYLRIMTPGPLSRKPCFRLEFSTTQAKGFILGILPFLRVKRVQAELALEFFSTRRPGLGRKPSADYISRSRIARQIKQANGRADTLGKLWVEASNEKSLLP